MAGYTLEVIAKEIGGEVRGDASVVVRQVRGVEEAADGDICVVIDRRYAANLAELHASAFIVAQDVEAAGLNLVRVGNPRAALIRVLEMFHPEAKRPGGIEAGAVVSPDARLGAEFLEDIPEDRIV